MDSQVYTILEKYYRNECSPEEVLVLMGHFNTASEQDLMNYIMKGFELEKKEMNYDRADKETLDAVYRNLEERIKRAKAKNTIATERRPLWPRYLSVAAAAAAIVFGIWFFFAPGNNTLRHPELVSGSPSNDIAPGHNGATLTYAGGKTINLSSDQSGVVMRDTQLVYNDNTPVEVASLGTNETLTITTAKGQTYSFTWVDGTKVWLNSASKLEFLPNFGNNTQRIVKLSGEVDFEVAKNKARPFIVQAGKQRIEVLGTHFNVKAYSDEPEIRTTLLEGSIRLANVSPFRGEMSAGQRGEILLKPNQQATNTGAAIKVEAVNAADAIAWKSGRFAFNRTSLEAVLREMGRWYNVDIKYPDGIPDEQFTGNINRNNTLAQALDILKFMKVKFEIQGRTIIVKK